MQTMCGSKISPQKFKRSSNLCRIKLIIYTLSTRLYPDLSRPFNGQYFTRTLLNFSKPQSISFISIYFKILKYYF